MWTAGWYDAQIYIPPLAGYEVAIEVSPSASAAICPVIPVANKVIWALYTVMCCLNGMDLASVL